NDESIAAIYAAKDRPIFNPLIVHVANVQAARSLVYFCDQAEALAQAFWPGAISMVLPRRDDCGLSLLVSAGLETVAIRVPAHPLAQNLLVRAACPIAAPSANRSGEVSPTKADHVLQSFTGIDGAERLLILDGGSCPVGLESTVIDLSGGDAILLRPGGITAEKIEAITGKLGLAGSNDNTPKSPGMLSRHYAPKKPLRLNVTQAVEGEVLLGFGPAPTGTVLNLSSTGNLSEAAANLFAMLHALDQECHTGIAVMPIPEIGLGIAINDRLHRAATSAKKM
ncbi:MAG: L-threonylcarbamoyladenylate synthase, partial [Rhodospirillales bacterium]|nr:L-threonylcarbamoyladenylate synthase [Rhodospirillales bacterium]